MQHALGEIGPKRQAHDTRWLAVSQPMPLTAATTRHSLRRFDRSEISPLAPLCPFSSSFVYLFFFGKFEEGRRFVSKTRFSRGNDIFFCFEWVPRVFEKKEMEEL